MLKVSVASKKDGIARRFYFIGHFLESAIASVVQVSFHGYDHLVWDRTLLFFCLCYPAAVRVRFLSRNYNVKFFSSLERTSKKIHASMDVSVVWIIIRPCCI